MSRLGSSALNYLATLSSAHAEAVQIEQTEQMNYTDKILAGFLGILLLCLASWGWSHLRFIVRYRWYDRTGLPANTIALQVDDKKKKTK